MSSADPVSWFFEVWNWKLTNVILNYRCNTYCAGSHPYCQNSLLNSRMSATWFLSNTETAILWMVALKIVLSIYLKYVHVDVIRAQWHWDQKHKNTEWSADRSFSTLSLSCIDCLSCKYFGKDAKTLSKRQTGKCPGFELRFVVHRQSQEKWGDVGNLSPVWIWKSLSNVL